jgi:indole-3-glycerol phosphate synthase
MSAHAPTVLERILASTREELTRRKEELPAAELEYQAFAASGQVQVGPSPFKAALQGPGMSVIAEFKRRSPSAGTLREAPDLHEVVRAYERGGASALSVLTEGRHFDGTLEDLRAARGACGLPILRKDFIVDEYQLYEAKVAGADAVLLIVAALESAQLHELHQRARVLGLDVLVEVHDRDELQSALALDAELIGVNNRDLRDFTVDLGRTEALARRIPEGTQIVAESGLASKADLDRLAEAGVHRFLVGETLMRQADVAMATRKLLTGA